MAMMKMTVYSKDFDAGQNVADNGFSGKIFVENGQMGAEFNDVDEALDFLTDNGFDLEEILYCRQKNGQQEFRRFKIGQKP